MYLTVKNRIQELLSKKSPKSKKQRYLYLHIPKTAGSAISTKCMQSKFKDCFICKRHEYPIHKLSFREKSYFTFASIRNPISWYASLYNFKMNTNPLHLVKDYPRMDNNSFEDFIEDIVLAKKGKEAFHKWHKPWKDKKHIDEMVRAYFDLSANEQIGFFTLNFLYYCFKSWQIILREKDINQFVIDNYNSLISVRKVIRVENLQIEFNELLKGTEIEVDLSERINSIFSNPYLSRFSRDTLDEIERRDRAIFEIFCYSQNKNYFVEKSN